MRDHRFEEGQRVGGVVAEILFRELHGFAGFDEGGEVHDSVDLLIREDAIESTAVGGVADD